MPPQSTAASTVIMAVNKFCFGECQAYLPRDQFPKRAGRFCKRCAGNISKAKYQERKNERAAFSHT